MLVFIKKRFLTSGHLISVATNLSLRFMQKFKFEKYVFLIGGMDLEMATIIQLLEINGLHYIDKHLPWGALLSAYKDDLNDNDTFVGIELTEDIKPPLHYICIDHHNENSSMNSSLEQVIELLQKDFGIEIEFTRDLQLIAANDKGYIPAMLNIDATPAEIADIRKRDKVAQGITDEDEHLAALSIQNHLTIEHGITIVKALTPRFATITDRLFPYDRLLIYTHDTLTYYGRNKDELTKAFNKLIEDKRAYHGGGKDGYFGISKKSLSTEELMQVKDELIFIISKHNQ
jgi:hypothetical protein